MSKFFQQLFLYIILFTIIFLPNPVFAENITMSAVGEYVMGDQDTYTEAKKLALQDAKRILLEKVGTYIESKTEVKDGIVKSDEIQQYSAGIIKVEEIGEERSILANKATVVKVNVKAILDPDALIKQVISFRNRKDIEESSKKLSVDNNKLRKEIEQLNQQLRNVVDENKYRQLSTQRKVILEKIDTNEKDLTLLLSGEGLYAAALLDRQKKDEGKQIVRNFLQAVPSTYILSVSKPEVEDNGDGTANLKFNVKVEANAFWDKKSGINWDEIWPTGLSLSSDYVYPAGHMIKLGCRKDKCLKTMEFAIQELESKQLFLYITLGQSNIKKKLFRCRNISQCRLGNDMRYRECNECNFMTKYTKNVNMKIALSELKELSQLKARVLYLDRSDFSRHDSDFSDDPYNWFNSPKLGGRDDD